MLCAVTVSKFPEGHPAHTAVTWRLSYSQPGLGCRETPGKTQPGFSSTRSHLASASCIGHCSQWNALNAASAVTQGSTSPASTPQDISLGSLWQSLDTQAAGDRTLVSHSSCQPCPEGFITAINAQWLKREEHGSLRAASLQGNPGKLCCSSGPVANVLFCQWAAFLMGRRDQLTKGTPLLPSLPQ